MSKLNPFDVQFCVRRLPKKLKEVMNGETWRGKVFIGGGYLRAVIAKEDLNDIDLFVQSKEDGAMLSGLLAVDKDAIYKTENAYTLKIGHDVIQIIHRWVFKTPEEISNSFDFTVCCAVIFTDGAQWDSYCDDEFYPDLAAKRLTYRNPIREEEAGGSALRILKYYQRGYRAPLKTYADVWARVFKQIGPTDDVAKVILGLLRDVDPDVDINHEAH
jgi:hypothetical protein